MQAAVPPSASDVFGSPAPALAAALAAPFAWTGSGLQPLPWFPFTVAASPSQTVAAARIAQRAERAYWFIRRQLGSTPRFRLLVLDPADWSRHAEVQPYGIAHFTASGHLVVGSHPAEAWLEVSRHLARSLPSLLLHGLLRQHGRAPRAPAGPDLAPVAEALIAHELAHVVAAQAGARFAHRHLAETFANYVFVAVLRTTDPAMAHRVRTLADSVRHLYGDLPTREDFDAADRPLKPVPSVLAQLALTRRVDAICADSGVEPLARWFALARRADGGQRIAESAGEHASAEAIDPRITSISGIFRQEPSALAA